MTNPTHSLYDEATGEFTGVMMTADLLAFNTPPGHAWAEGEHDARSRSVRLVTDDFGDQIATVAARTPPRPDGGVYRAWEWDATAEDWRAVPTLAAIKATACAPWLAVLADLDAKAARPTSEIIEAMALGLTPPAAALDRLREVHEEKLATRAKIAAIGAAEANSSLATAIAG